MLKWARKIIKETGLKSPRIICQADYGNTGNLRNIIYQGIYKGKPSVLKIYDQEKRVEKRLQKRPHWSISTRSTKAKS